MSDEWIVDGKRAEKNVLALLMQGWEMTQISYFIKLSQLIEFVYRLLKCQTLHLTSVTRPFKCHFPSLHSQRLNANNVRLKCR